jgi:hypothetical protein
MKLKNKYSKQNICIYIYIYIYIYIERERESNQKFDQI